MNGTLVELLLVSVIVVNLGLLGSASIAGSVRLTAFQGFLVGLLTLTLGRSGHVVESLLLGAGVAAIKGILFPLLLGRAVREARVSREVEPYGGFTLSVLGGVAIFLGALWLGGRISVPVRSGPGLGLIMPVAFTAIMTGLLIIVSRRQAVMQVVGYLTMESGMYIFGVGLASEVSLLVELGVLLDLFVAVFIMGIAIYHIQREFDHMDVERLDTLRG